VEELGCVHFRCQFGNDDGKQQKINVIYKQFVLLTFVTFVKKTTIDKIDNSYLDNEC
jgi:hypothetical protein